MNPLIFPSLRVIEHGRSVDGTAGDMPCGLRRAKSNFPIRALAERRRFTRGVPLLVHSILFLSSRSKRKDPAWSFPDNSGFTSSSYGAASRSGNDGEILSLSSSGPDCSYFSGGSTQAPKLGTTKQCIRGDGKRVGERLIARGVTTFLRVLYPLGPEYISPHSSLSGQHNFAKRVERSKS